MSTLVFKKFERDFRSDRNCFNITKAPRYLTRYHIFVKRKHKIIQFLGIMTVMPSKDMVFELNYLKCFYWIGRLRLDKTATQILFNHEDYLMSVM